MRLGIFDVDNSEQQQQQKHRFGTWSMYKLLLISTFFSYFVAKMNGAAIKGPLLAFTARAATSTTMIITSSCAVLS